VTWQHTGSFQVLGFKLSPALHEAIPSRTGCLSYWALIKGLRRNRSFQSSEGVKGRNVCRYLKGQHTHSPDLCDSVRSTFAAYNFSKRASIWRSESEDITGGRERLESNRASCSRAGSSSREAYPYNQGVSG
jgi:hypothetical protein